AVDHVGELAHRRDQVEGMQAEAVGIPGRRLLQRGPEPRETVGDCPAFGADTGLVEPADPVEEAVRPGIELAHLRADLEDGRLEPPVVPHAFHGAMLEAEREPRDHAECGHQHDGDGRKREETCFQLVHGSLRMPAPASHWGLPAGLGAALTTTPKSYLTNNNHIK